jgi:hypothetical protein
MPTPFLGADLIAIAVLVVPVIATVIAEPDRSDVYAVIGAMLGAFLGFLKARAHHKNWLDTSYIVVLRSTVGACGPGALVAVAPVVLPDSVAPLLRDLTWHTFAGLGFVFSLNAESLAAFIHAVLPKWLKTKTPTES